MKESSISKNVIDVMYGAMMDRIKRENEWQRAITDSLGRYSLMFMRI